MRPCGPCGPCGPSGAMRPKRGRRLKRPRTADHHPDPIITRRPTRHPSQRPALHQQPRYSADCRLPTANPGWRPVLHLRPGRTADRWPTVGRHPPASSQCCINARAAALALELRSQGASPSAVLQPWIFAVIRWLRYGSRAWWGVRGQGVRLSAVLQPWIFAVIRWLRYGSRAWWGPGSGCEAVSRTSALESRCHSVAQVRLDGLAETLTSEGL
jgi:hypothetical protein